MRPLRIAVASSGLGHVCRGIESWAADLARALSARGENVTLFKGAGKQETDFERIIPCWQRDSAILQRILPRLRGAWRFGLGSPYEVEQATFGFHLLRHLRQQRIDVLHVQDPRVALIAQWARRLGIVRTATVLAHGTEEPLGFQRRIRYLQHLAPWHLEQARAAGVWRPTWTAIPNFIDTDVFHPGRARGLRAELDIPHSHVVVLTVAAIKREHKRIDYLIDEFARLRAARRDLPATLVIAGGFERDTEHLIALGRARLGDRVRFLVRFPRLRMPELYRAADLFVLCSLFEMMPIAVLEAAASGLPCLVHSHPVLAWMAGAGAQTVDMSAPGALAGALARLIEDRGSAAQLGAAARRHCGDVFSRDRVVERILAYYQFVHAAARSAGRMVGSAP